MAKSPIPVSRSTVALEIARQPYTSYSLKNLDSGLLILLHTHQEVLPLQLSGSITAEEALQMEELLERLLT